MASIIATIDIDFQAEFAGDHRVCWRIQGSGDPYDCSTIVTCAGGGTPCATAFTTTVNDTSCDGDVTFEGYIQATCENLASLAGRLTWTVSFTPVPVCVRYEISSPVGQNSWDSAGPGVNPGSGQLFTDCSGVDTFRLDDIFENEPFAVCVIDGDPSALLLDAGDPGGNLVVNKVGCCISADSDSTVCTNVNIENSSGGPLIAQVTECGGFTSDNTILDGTTQSFCAIEDGVNIKNQALTVTDLGTSC